MPAFDKNEGNSWRSRASAMGPFSGLQGGAVAGLMTCELEQLACANNLGNAVSASIEFLRPTKPGKLRTQADIVHRGRRVSVLSNKVFQEDKCTARASVCFIHSIDTPAIAPPPQEIVDPQRFSILPTMKAIHGQPWMMDNFEVRRSENGVMWFRYINDIVSGMTPMARVLGPADWTHGLDRPNSPRLADPNINLTVVLSRPPIGEFIGIQPQTTWMPSGIGMGDGVLSDQEGPFGRVMMSVALTELV